MFLAVILMFDLALINVRHDNDQRHHDASRTDFMEIWGETFKKFYSHSSAFPGFFPVKNLNSHISGCREKQNPVTQTTSPLKMNGTLSLTCERPQLQPVSLFSFDLLCRNTFDSRYVRKQNNYL